MTKEGSSPAMSTMTTLPSNLTSWQRRAQVLSCPPQLMHCRLSQYSPNSARPMMHHSSAAILLPGSTITMQSAHRKDLDMSNVTASSLFNESRVVKRLILNSSLELTENDFGHQTQPAPWTFKIFSCGWYNPLPCPCQALKMAPRNVLVGRRSRNGRLWCWSPHVHTHNTHIHTHTHTHTRKTLIKSFPLPVINEGDEYHSLPFLFPSIPFLSSKRINTTASH